MSKLSSDPKGSIWIKHRLKLVLLLIVAQVLFLLAITGSYYNITWNGQEIRIQTAPVDPRDLLYGDYVILNYDISRIDSSLWKGTTAISEANSALFVVLKPMSEHNNAIYEAIGVYDYKPDVNADEVWIRARLDYNYSDTLFMKYGIEQFYVPENTGKELEDKVGEMAAVLRVSSSGRAVIIDLES